MDFLSKFSHNRLLIFRILLGLSFLGVMLRFFQVQIIQGDRYFEESERNRVRQITIEPPRGLILDRFGEILVDNSPGFSVFAIPKEVSAQDSTFITLGRILQKSPQELRQRMIRERRGPFQKVKLARFVDFATLANLEEHKLDLPGIVFNVEPSRYYPSGVLAPHLFGYLGEITEENLAALENKGYERGDLIGKKGIEKVYEKELRGEKGIRYVEVDALGREVQILKDFGEKNARPGKNLHLSIDAELQRHLETVMQERRGGAVVLNCKNGEIIAIVSKPDYDPSLFAKPISHEAWTALVNDPDHPLYDRMVQSSYPPGSTYKLIAAIAALEKHLINPATTVYCPGYFRLGRRVYECWKKGGHGNVNMMQAIEQSCNVYFWRAAQRIGLQNWVEYSRKFHFGEHTGVDLYGESPGLVADSLYLNARYGTGKWSRGLLLNLGIGQGDLLVTPLQMATFAMALANKGVSFRPHLARAFVDPLTGDETYVTPDTVLIKGISDSTWSFIHRGMYLVVNDPSGTAKSANPGQIKVAGKTGTAQNPHGDSHAWFIGFAPFEDPQIAFAIFIENGGGGGANAAPLVRDMLKLLLREKKIRIPTKESAVAD